MSSPAPPCPPSSSSIHTVSARSTRPHQSALVITSPPWAKDEPPSPKEEASIDGAEAGAFSRHSADVHSHQSSSFAGSPYRWWTFTLPRPKDVPPHPYQDLPESHKKASFRDRRVSWLPSPISREGSRQERTSQRKDKARFRDWNLSIALPTPAIEQPYTLSHNATPGWNTPWTSRPGAQGPDRRRSNSFPYTYADDTSDQSIREHMVWRKRRKHFRSFILTNTYVPLLFRFTNITFTTAALGVAVRIRKLEQRYALMGALGSSPTLVIIIAPLTLIHVMMAIYLEYFGRPLGLWRTSAKLAHTLSEVVFICAWSAALSLSFDNFFTSLIPCASMSSIAWYSQLPRPPSNLPVFEGSIGDRLCDDQLALICLVGVGLSMYCINLFISLFRIFEKVKYHPAATIQTQ